VDTLTSHDRVTSKLAVRSAVSFVVEVDELRGASATPTSICRKMSLKYSTVALQNRRRVVHILQLPITT
jgi:hypothetical protein